MRTSFYSVLLLAIFFFSACSKESINPTDQDQILSGSKPNLLKGLSLADDSLPQLHLTFHQISKEKRTYRIIFKDSNLLNFKTLEVSLELFVHKQTLNGSPSGERILKPLVFKKRIDQATPVLQSELVQINTPIENTILDVLLVYVSEGKKVQTFLNSVFVFGDGKTALQEPRILKIGTSTQFNNTKETPLMIGHWTWTDGGISHEDSWDTQRALVLVNDPANEVASADLVFSEKMNGPKPNQIALKIEFEKAQLRLKKDKGWIRQSLPNKEILGFSANPDGFKYEVAFTLKDAKGNGIGAPQNTVLSMQKANIPKIKNIRIREVTGASGTVSYKVVTILDNDLFNQVNFVELDFLDPFTGPKPTNRSIGIPTRPTTNLGSAHERRFVDDQLSFETNAAGYTYATSVLMRDFAGRAIGETQKINVTIERGAKDTKADPKVNDLKIYSADGGKTWTIETNITDMGEWVENAILEFVKPYPGASPVTNPIKLSLTGEKTGNIKTFTRTGIQFEGDPIGISYRVLMTFSNGKGTRAVSTTSTGKPGLL